MLGIVKKSWVVLLLERVLLLARMWCITIPDSLFCDRNPQILGLNKVRVKVSEGTVQGVGGVQGGATDSIWADIFQLLHISSRNFWSN